MYKKDKLGEFSRLKCGDQNHDLLCVFFRNTNVTEKGELSENFGRLMNKNLNREVIDDEKNDETSCHGNCRSDDAWYHRICSNI